MSDFPRAVEIILQLEGGYTVDSGGETKFGISKRAYPALDIANLTIDQAKGIYFEDYWSPNRCDDIPWPLNCYVFDAAVNTGVATAAKALQKLVKAPVDGIVGPVTLALVKDAPGELHRRYLAQRIMDYSAMSGFPAYGRGWVYRVVTLQEMALRST